MALNTDEGWGKAQLSRFGNDLVFNSNIVVYKLPLMKQNLWLLEVFIFHISHLQFYLKFKENNFFQCYGKILVCPYSTYIFLWEFLNDPSNMLYVILFSMVLELNLIFLHHCEVKEHNQNYVSFLKST